MIRAAATGRPPPETQPGAGACIGAPKDEHRSIRSVAGVELEQARIDASAKPAQTRAQILRIAHLGYYDATDILGLLATLEIVLRRLGHRFDLGAGLAAAEAEYLRLTP